MSWAGLPLGTPPQAEALRALAGELPPPPEAAEGLARLRGTFTDIEQDTLAGGELPFDAATFRDALGLRLRLALALAHLERAPGAPHADALNALLAEVDAVLDRLRTSEAGSAPAVLERLQFTRDALVQDAVRLSEVGSSTRAPAPAAPAPRRPEAAAAGKLVAYSSADVRAEASRTRKRGALVALMLVLVVAAVGLQVQRSRKSFTPAPTVAGAPAGTSVRQDSRGGLMVRSLDSSPLSAEVQRWAATYEQRGFHRRPLGANAFYLEPPTAAPPTRRP